MKNLTIGIFGCSAFNPNLGCSALHYSLLLLLEKICKERNVMFRYIVFDFDIDPCRAKMIRSELQIDADRCTYVQAPKEPNAKTVKGAIKKIIYLSNNQKAYEMLKQCDVVIDLSQGDSFSDIYGFTRFYEWARVKEKIEKLNIPLVLGPQTYGPFIDSKVRDYAIEIVNNATLIISRDEESKSYVGQYTKKSIISGTDLAFLLPYNKDDKGCHCFKKIRVGINPSGLLGKKRNDYSDLRNDLTVDYDEFICRLIAELNQEDKYEVHLISHVGNEAKECFGDIEGVIYHDAFSSPIEAKNTIAQMDVFVGARMHATIAAFSSGVATIPTAYSMKFKGVFSGIGYDRVIDLRNMSTENAVNKTMEYIKYFEVLRHEVYTSQIMMNEKYNCMMIALSKCLEEV